MHEVRWERMFRDELEEAFARCPTVYFTYGLCEPHGPHNALGLDGLKAHAIACEAARAGGGVVAPPDWWHVHEIGVYAAWASEQVGEVDRAWLTAVPPWHHFKSVLYHIRAADALGFHAAILLTGHYGPNYHDLRTLVDLVQPHVGCRLYGMPDFEANEPGFDPQTNDTRDHAGRVETSLLWATEPACVDLSRLPPSDAAGPHFAAGRNAHESDRRVGQRMVADEVRWLVRKAGELREAYQREQPTRRLTTFEAVERVWAEVVLPEVSRFRSMAPASERAQLPSGSRWAANAAILPPR